jgi:O-antigen/teichoic acid export membrane protein
VTDPSESPEPRAEEPSLQRRVTRGLTWTVVETWGRQGLNLVVFVILARLLTPLDFGLVALATVFVALAQLLVDQGLGDALIQRREITREHIDTAFWAAVATGLLLTLIGLLIAEPVATALEQPRLAAILQVLSLSFVLGAFTSIQIALMRRAFEFRALALRAVGAALGGGAIGIGMAAAGLGAWALVGQQLASAAISVLLLWWVSPWRPGLRFSRAHFRDLFRFGLNVVGSDTLSFVSRNVDNLLIGVVLGPVPLGYYAVAYRILAVTQALLVNVARKIAFPAFSRLQGDPQRLRRAYYRLTRSMSVLIMPGYIALAIAAPELIVSLFGSTWEESGPVAAVLFLIGPVLTVQAFAASLLNAAGHPEVVLRFRLITSLTNVIGFLIAVPFGIVAVAAAFVLRGYLLLPLILRWMGVYGAIPPREYLAQLRGVFLATATMAAAMLAAKALMAGQPPLLLLFVELSVGVGAAVITLLVIERALLHDVAAVAREAASRRGRGRSSMPPDGRAPADITRTNVEDD